MTGGVRPYLLRDATTDSCCTRLHTVEARERCPHHWPERVLLAVIPERIVLDPSRASVSPVS